MPEITLTTGSPELAKERKLIRELIIAISKNLGKEASRYKFRRIKEEFGGCRKGYSADYILIESGKKDRLFQELKLSFATLGNSYSCRSDAAGLKRVVVHAWGTTRVEITEPREKTLTRTVYSGDNEITFDRERPRHVQANAVVKMLEIQQATYDKGKASVLKDMARWDKFATAIKRVRAALNIPAKNVWRNSHHNEYEVRLSILSTKSRKASGSIVMDVFGKIKIRVDDLTEQRLFKVVTAFK